MKKERRTKNIGYHLERATRVVKLHYLQAFNELGVDITPEQWVLLDNLYQNNGLSQTELAALSFKNTPTISRILDLLAKKGLIERQRFENDRRRFKIFLTPKGIETVEKSLEVVANLREQGWRHLSEEDYDTFLRIINQVFENYEGSKVQ